MVLVGWADRGRAERRRCVGWDGRIEEKWVAPLRCVVRAGGCEGVGGASGVAGAGSVRAAGLVVGRVRGLEVWSGTR